MRKYLVTGYKPCSRKPQTRINTSFSASAQGHTRYVRNRRNLFFSALISQISLRIQQMSSSNQNQNTTKTTVSIFHHLQPQALSNAVGSAEEIIYAWPIIVICGSRPTNRQSADCLNCFTKNREDAIERTIKQRKKKTLMPVCCHSQTARLLGLGLQLSCSPYKPSMAGHVLVVFVSDSHFLLAHSFCPCQSATVLLLHFNAASSTSVLIFLPRV